MVVCRYFLQGYCKFGDRCRYQHYQENRSPSPVATYRNYNRSWHAPPHEQPHHGPRAGSPVARSQVAGGASLNPLDLAEAIKEDVVAMEEGGQWPLTCYTPSKDFGCFPGFHDTSVEEVRFEAYQALASGTFDQYVKKFESLMQATRMKWGMLKNPTGQVMSVIEKMASGQGASSAGSHASGLSSFSFAASFNSPAAQPSGFSLGGNASFGGGAHAAAFSPHHPGPSPLPASNFTFTLDPQPPSGAGPPFGSPSPPPAFGMVPPVFGQSGGLMFGTSSADVAAQQQAMSSSSVFFSGHQEQPSGEKQGSAFGSVHTTPLSGSTGFGAGAFHANKVGSQQQQQMMMTAAQSVSVGAYTPLGDLSEAERREFSAVTFTLGSIPLRPPPCEMCI